MFVPCALAWVLIASDGPSRVRVRHAALVLLPIVLLVGGWMARNWRVVGAPVLTTEAGESLYLGNGPLTFTHFPEESIDLSYGEFETLPSDEQRRLESLAGQDVALDALLRQWALDYIAAHPAGVAWAAVRKLWVSASAQLSPARSPIVQWGFRAVFLPVHVLAIIGFLRAHPRGARTPSPARSCSPSSRRRRCSGRTPAT